MNNIYKIRIKRVLKQLKNDSKLSALLVSSAPQRLLSRDSELPYRQSSDFYYLTGCNITDAVLFISAKDQQAYLFARKISPQEVLWTGAGENAQHLAQSIGAQLILTENIRKEVLQKIKGHELLYYQNEADSLGAIITNELMNLPSHQRYNFPANFKHLDLIIGEMRLIKDRHEISLIKKAIQISADCLSAASELITAGNSEQQIATFLENKMRELECETAFQTIVASGSSAAVLHYHQHTRKLKNGEMLLLDYGARFQGYCADISRTIPVSGAFSSWQKELYSIVLEAQQASISKIRPGVLMKTVYEAAANVLTRGLIDMKIIKAPLKSAIAKKLYAPFFPHGIGHSLGIDVHDVNNHSKQASDRLQAGMVVTIEPGLYFTKAIKKIPVCGIRIEDDILVTAKGSENLSSAIIPKY